MKKINAMLTTMLKALTSDKAMHFLYSYVLTTIFIPLAIIFAIGKEWYDSKQEGNHWCWWDLLADALGMACAWIVMYLV